MKNSGQMKVVQLAQAPGNREAWNKPAIFIALWMMAEYFFVTNPLQVSSGLRRIVLQAFGAKIGKNVILRPRVRVKFPWNLEIGSNSWVGEGVWFHNQNKITVGENVCISQETFITTGSHAFSSDMALITEPVVIEDGAWVCARAVITMGSIVGKSAIVPAGVVVKGRINAGTINNQSPRFKT